MQKVHRRMTRVCSVFILCLCLAHLQTGFAISPQHLLSVKHSVHTDNAKDLVVQQEEFQGLLKSIGNFISNVKSNSVQQLDIYRSVDVSYNCLNDTENVIEDLTKKEEYAIRFLDADTKVPSGILQGMWFWPGDYRECIDIESPYNIHTRHSFKGRYFTVKVHEKQFDAMTMVGGLALGVCLPDSCHRTDVASLINLAFSSVTQSNKTAVKDVYTTERQELDSSDIAAIVISSIILSLVLIGTLIDYCDKSRQIKYNKSEPHLVNGYTNIEAVEIDERSKLLLKQDHSINSRTNCSPTILRTLAKGLKSFSFFGNSKKLVNTSTAMGPLACLNGLRVLSMCWVIQGHTYGFSVLSLKDVIPTEMTLNGRFTFQAIVKGDFSVDTFFFLSGLLVAYLAMKELSTKGRLNWLYFFLHRYWRLTPIYAFCLMFFTTVYLLMITGPYVWLATDPTGPFYSATDECKTYWWSNLLYINNIYPHYGSETNCMGWSWYLANDMQFYMLLSPIVIILLHKNRKVGIAFCVFLIVGCIGSRAFIVHYYGMDQQTTITKHRDDPWGQHGPLYTKPYARCSVYIVGMLTGYLLHITKCKIRINTVYTILGWAMSIAMALSVVYGLYHFNRTQSSMSEAGSIFYVSFCRTAWALSLAWLVIACATGRGGWVNNILAWPLWAPLGRLTYAAYLVHPMVVFGFYFNLVAPFPFSDLMFVYLFISNVVLSYGVAYIVSMVIEAPMMQLEKLLVNKF